MIETSMEMNERNKNVSILTPTLMTLTILYQISQSYTNIILNDSGSD